MIAADFHVHTCYSPDALTRPEEVVWRATMHGIERVVIADHGTIEGALRAHEINAAQIIVGQEIRCGCGTELIGIYMHRMIPDGLSIEETVARLRDQGALIYMPHPFAYLRRVHERTTRALALVDAIEGFNSRAFWPAWNRRAREAATARGIPVAAGSDAHFPHEIGRARTWLPEFHDAPSLRAALQEARVGEAVQIGSPFLHVASVALWLGWRWLRFDAAGTLRGRQATTAPMQPLSGEPS